MKFTLICPHCQKHLEVEEKWAGQETTCPVCGKPLKLVKPQVTHETASPEQTAQSCQPAAPQFQSPRPQKSTRSSVFALIAILLMFLNTLAGLLFNLGTNWLIYHQGNYGSIGTALGILNNCRLCLNGFFPILIILFACISYFSGRGNGGKTKMLSGIALGIALVNILNWLSIVISYLLTLPMRL